MSVKKTIAIAGATILLGMMLVGTAMADSVVYVGYSDGLRGPGFFPSPWAGDPSVTTFVGTTSPYDAGALRVHNSGVTPFTIDDVTVTFWQGSTFDLWGSGHVVGSGEDAVFTQTGYYNFDTSDLYSFGDYRCLTRDVFCDSIAPDVAVTINGVTTHYADYGHVLDTYAFDLATRDNESIGWHVVGDTAIDRNNVPEPSSIMMLGSGLLALAGVLGRKFKK